MDDTPAKETPGDNINKLDLSAFEAFQFGTQWTDTGASKGASEERGEAPRSRPPGDSPFPRRDRRAGGRPGGREFGDRPSHADRGEGRPPPRESFRSGGDRPPGRERQHEGEGGHFNRGPRFERGGPPRPAGPPRPYQSPVFEVIFYPDDDGFSALVKAMRASSRTYELFEIARLILGKPERCAVVFRRYPDENGVVPPLFICIPDGLPFATEDEAISHAFDCGLDRFFTVETVEVEPPKGNFQFVNRCPVTGDLLGPPNYHRYAQMVQHHYNARGIHMPFERYKASIEVVRDPEAVAAWLESMKKATRYTFTGETTEARTVFDNVEDARAFLLRVCRDKIVRPAETARVPAKAVEAAGRTEAGRAMQGALEAQRRFPLDTANALRGRLRRENFHIFKRGAKGITYVCAVRRKFRQPGQTFSESINRLLSHLEAHPMTPVGELAPGMLGFALPGASAPSVPPPPPTEEGAPAAPPAAAELTAEQKVALSRLAIDLRWLINEGYVAEFSDGRLFAQPVMDPEQAARDEAAASGQRSGGRAEDLAGVQPGSEEAAEDGASEAEPEAAAGVVPIVDEGIPDTGATPDAVAGDPSGGPPRSPDVQPEQ